MITTKGHNLQPDELAGEIARLARKESELFREYVRNLPEKKWLTMSFCTDWTIKDVVEHNILMGKNFLEIIRAVSKGETETLIYSRETNAQYEANLANLNRLELANVLAEDTHEMYDLLAKATPQMLETKIKMPYGYVRVGDVAGIRLNELSLHSWDVRVVDDLTAKVTRENLPLMIPGLVRFMPNLANRPTLEKVGNLSYQFEITGSINGPAAFSVNQGKPEATPDYVENPNVVMKIDADAFLRLAWGRLKLDWMIKNGWIKVEGDKDAALKLPEIFQGV